jgi:diguanylate cyclase (GGDEF)-like protein
MPNTLWKEMGYSYDDMRQDSWMRFIHPQDYSIVEQFYRGLMAGTSDTWQGEYRIRAKDGTYHTIQHRAVVLERASGAVPRLYVGWDVDVSAHIKKIEEARAMGEYNRRKYLQAEELRNTGAILASELDSSSSADHILRQAKRLVPYDAAILRSVEDQETVVLASVGFDQPRLLSLTKSRIPLGSDSPLNVPTVLSLYTGPYRSFMRVPLLRRDSIVGFLDFYSLELDVYGVEEQSSSMIFAEQAAIAFYNSLRYKASELEAATDWLTGLSTRRSFMARASRLSLECDAQLPIAALMIDIDHFKQINDNYGHPVGDSVLVALAQVCREALRSEDVLCRYGGEEILVLLPGVDEKVALIAAERLRSKVELIRIPKHPEIRVTVSGGVSEGTVSEDFRELVARADEALYRAKESGRNRCVSR